MCEYNLLVVFNVVSDFIGNLCFVKIKNLTNNISANAYIKDSCLLHYEVVAITTTSLKSATTEDE